MAQASAWYTGNDMRVRLAGLISTTGGSTGYINNSTGVFVDIWKSRSTDDFINDRIITNTRMPYVAGTNGNYEVAIQSTGYTMAQGTHGMAVIRARHGGLNGEWREGFRVVRRMT